MEDPPPLKSPALGTLAVSQSAFPLAIPKALASPVHLVWGF